MHLFVRLRRYAYYGVMTLAGPDLRSAIRKLGADMMITTIQILQMAMGITVTVTSQYCEVPPSSTNMALTFGMYAIYLVLFMELFYSKYIKSKPKASKDAAPLPSPVAEVVKEDTEASTRFRSRRSGTKTE